MNNITINKINKKLICPICNFDKWNNENVIVSLRKDYNFSCSNSIVMLTCVNCGNILFFEKEYIINEL